MLKNMVLLFGNIENKEHWVLDVTFEEDKSRIRAFNSPQNLAVLRRMAL